VGFVEQVLVFLGVELAASGRLRHRVLAMLRDVGAGAILADADVPGRISGVDVIRPRAEVAQVAVIPAEVLPVSAGGQHQDPAIPHTAVDGSCGITVNAGARGHGAIVEVGGETAATSDAREGEKTTSRQDYKPG
jgi:hypothetical protein